MKKAYLIVDMSNDFVHEDGGLTAGAIARGIVPSIIKRADEFIKNGDIVVFCMDEHEADDAHFELWPRHNVKDSWGVQIYGALGEWYKAHADGVNAYYVAKSEYDAFYKTELAGILNENNICTVYVAGVCTDICVLNTVYGAYKEGFKTVVSGAECATFTQNHALFLNHMNLIYKTEII